nr:serine/arginine repetitive matrix protein 1 isoform X1 [Nothobranchius furzeri]
MQLLGNTSASFLNLEKKNFQTTMEFVSWTFFRDRLLQLPGGTGNFTKVAHLDTHKELTQRRQRKVKLDLKRKVALQLLRELRATDPQPPMVSTLDLDGDLAAGEGNTCANPACRTRATYLTNEVYLLQGALADAKRQLQQLQPQQASSPPEPRHGHGQGLRSRASASAPSRTSPTAPLELLPYRSPRAPAPHQRTRRAKNSGSRGRDSAVGHAPRLPPPRAPPLPPPQRRRARSPMPSPRSPRPSPRSPRGVRSSLRWTHGGLNRI